MMEMKFLAKIEHTRNRSDTSPLRIKAFLIQLLLKHQNVDPTFQLLPHDTASTAGVITKASEIPNTETDMKTYIKEMKDQEHRNNTKTYTISFFVKVASSMTLGSMKKDDGLFIWLRNNKIWIKAHNFATTYDVINVGFVSHMKASLHHRDRVNGIVQASLKTHHPNLEIQLVPTTIKHGLYPKKKRITQIVSCQVDRALANEAREALVHVFQLSAALLPKNIFFVPAPVHGAISYELYYSLVNAHHEHMANIRSFAVTGISDLKAAMLAQVTTDADSSIETTLEQIIMDAKIHGTNDPIFLSIEPTNTTQTEGRYLLLMEKHKISAAEHMIDELVKYISANPTLSATMTIPGQEIRRANRVQVSNAFDGYANFLVSKVPTTVITNPAQNAWHKRRGNTSMDYVNEQYPPLVDSSKKPRMNSNATAATADSTDAMDSTIVDLEAELEKERAYHEKRIEEVRKSLTDEITKMKLEFTKEMRKAIESSEKRMTDTIQTHIGDIMRTSNEAVLRMEHKAHELTASLMAIMNKPNDNASSQNETSPPRKQYRRDIDGNVDDDGDDKMVTPFASPASPTHNRGDPAAGAKK
jgi:hypothetical protein